MALTNTLSAICLLLSCASACDTTEVTRCSGSSGGSWYAPVHHTDCEGCRPQYVHTEHAGWPDTACIALRICLTLAE